MKGWPILGSLPELRRDPISFFGRALREHGDIAQMQMGHVRVHLVMHPDLVRHVLQDNNKNYDKSTRGYKIMRGALGQGLLTSEGDFWLRQRRIAQPAFHKRRINAFATQILSATDAMLDRWQSQHNQHNKKALDISSELMALTLRVVTSTLFGADSDPPVEQVAAALETTLRILNKRTQSVFLPENVPTPQNIKFRNALRVIDDIVNNYIRARRANASERDDLLSLLIQARDEDTGESMTDSQLRDEAFTLFVAGHETTASALSWTFYLLSKHPDIARRLHAEVDSVLAGAPPTADNLTKLPYTAQVFDEAMRLYPPAWMIARRAINADTLGPYHIPADAYLLISPYITHRHPDFWENPEGFDPDRFATKPDSSKSDRPRFAYFPFGGGPRLCIGQAFALMEGRLILARIAQRFRLDLLPCSTVTPEPLITLRVRHGLWMTPFAR